MNLSNGNHTTSITHSYSVKSTSQEMRSPQNLDWLLYDLYIRRQFTICKQIISNLLKQNNNRSDYCYHIQGLVLREENKLQDSLQSFQKCCKINSKNVENIKQVGQALFLLGRYHLALVTYKEAEALKERADWEIYHYIAECMLRGAGGSRQESLHYLKRAVQNGRQVRSCRLLAEQLTRDGDLTAASTVYEAALEVMPDGAWLHAELGLLLLEQGETQAAFERLGTAVALRSDCERAVLAVASVMQSHGDYDAALAKYKVAAQNCADTSELWNNIGLCFYSKEKLVTALSCLSRAARLSPLSASVLYSLGLVLLAAQQPASAFLHLSAAANIRPQHAASYMLLAVALQHLGDLTNASLAFERASMLLKTPGKRFNQNDFLIPLNRALFLVSLDDKKKASEELLVFKEMAQGFDLSEKVMETAKVIENNLDIKPEVEQEQHEPNNIINEENNDEKDFEIPNDINSKNVNEEVGHIFEEDEV